MSRLRFTSADEIFETFPALAKLVRTTRTAEHPLAFLARLAGGPAPGEAIAFAAFLMPRREAVWWAIQCVQAVRPDANGESRRALAAAEAWARDPDDATRRKALEIGVAGDPDLPATWVALAAGYSGGSMIEGHMVPCPPDLTAKMARTAVQLALVGLPVGRRPAAFADCVTRCARLMGDDARLAAS